MIPIPLRDHNPTSRAPFVTIMIILVNAVVWVFELQRGVMLAVLDYGVIPAWLLRGIREGRIFVEELGWVHLYQEVSHPLSILTSMFLHGSWMHIIGNMWFLWVFGDNVEDEMGHLRFLFFYLACGILAALSQVVIMPDSTVPMVGASGAIAGALGAYIVLHPHARVHCLWILIIFVTTIQVPAWLLLGMWFLSQFFIPTNSGIAWMAHVGGFVAGAILGPLLARRSRRLARRQPAVQELRWE
ncbi:MAG: rhomboid family intramembrane serine protease [Myxococcales bacterium]|nr:rhomboid family intramembrane serine protease [Myxococcota bacterium]MDW8280914.1 rhomboid family intramembrane serine protease [Myxococcales bacterium]